MRGALRIAYFSPLPPVRSGIADYSRELLPHLAERADVALFTSGAVPALPADLPMHPLSRYPELRWNFDVAVYQMGNSVHHTDIYQMLTRYPGVVVLHDYFLHHFIAHTTSGEGDYPAYARELHYALGDRAPQRELVVRRGFEPPPLFEVPLNDRLLDASLALIVHSQHALDQIKKRNGRSKVKRIPQLVAPRDGQSRRAELDLPEGVVLFAVVGQVTAAKQLNRVLRAIDQLRQQGTDAHLLIAGELLPEVDLPSLLIKTNTVGVVTSLGYIDSLDAFVDWIATADIIVNLRYPTLGETSAAALRALDQGRPLIVYDHGWYAELPDGVAAKVPPLDDEALANVMTELASDAERRQRMGDAARAYVNQTSRPDRVAEAYVDFLCQLQAGWRHGG